MRDPGADQQSQDYEGTELAYVAQLVVGDKLIEELR
jgi:hypothetical protein